MTDIISQSNHSVLDDAISQDDATKPNARRRAPFVECRGVSVKFPQAMVDDFSMRRSALRIFGKQKPKIKEAKYGLKNINLTAQKGERIGLIGGNGSGKTTLLRILMGVYPPTKGIVRRYGKTSSMINTTMGMDLFLSGYENIKLRGNYLGLSNKEVSKLVPEIEDFCELGDALFDPIKTYSSGMLARLSFGISTIVTADIYLMDEWIGAGDARFFERANERMKALFHDDAILFLASHSDGLIKNWCNRVLVIDNGEIVMDTTPDIGIEVKNRILGV